MPCQDIEEEMNAPGENPPCTPVKVTGNGGAGRVDPDTENDSDEDDFGEDSDRKKKRKWNGRLQYRIIKQWVTGDRAVMDSEDIDRELFELARDFMSASKLKKLPSHVPKPTDHAMWKQYRAYTTVRRISFRCFRCPLRHHGIVQATWLVSELWKAPVLSNWNLSASTMPTAMLTIAQFI